MKAAVTALVISVWSTGSNRCSVWYFSCLPQSKTLVWKWAWMVVSLYIWSSVHCVLLYGVVNSEIYSGPSETLKGSSSRRQNEQKHTTVLRMCTKTCEINIYTVHQYIQTLKTKSINSKWSQKQNKKSKSDLRILVVRFCTGIFPWP